MCLTDKEKRMIASPLSLSARQKRNTKYRIKKKVHEILQDMEFVLENHKTISDDFGINVLNYDKLSKYFTNNVVEKNHDIPSTTSSSLEEKTSDDDPDLL